MQIEMVSLKTVSRRLDGDWLHLPTTNDIVYPDISGLLLLTKQTDDNQDNCSNHGNAGDDDANYRASGKLFLVTIVITTTVAITVGRAAGSDKSFLALWAVIVVIISYISAFYIHNLTIYRVLLTKC